MKRYDITNVKQQTTHVREMLTQAEQQGSGSGGSFRQGLRFIVEDDTRSVELYHQLEKLWKSIDCLSENDQ